MRHIIGIVGSRSRDTVRDFKAVEQVFLALYKPGDLIVSGGCRQGGDRFAEAIAAKHGPSYDRPLPITIHRPDEALLDPELLSRNPRAAWAVINYARNTKIAQDATHLIACVALNRQGGTEDTIKKFTRKYYDARKTITRESRAIVEGYLFLV